MTQIIIARHGNTFDKEDIVTRVGSRTDLALSLSGKEQAIALGAHLKSLDFLFDIAFCSILQRTRQTAELVLTEVGQELAPIVKGFLTEIDYGPDENLPEDVVQQRIGMAALALWENQAVPPQGWIVDPENLKAQWKAFFQTVQDDYANKTVLVVTSNEIARFALQAIAPETSYSLKLKTGAYGHLSFKDGEWKIVDWNIRP